MINKKYYIIIIMMMLVCFAFADQAISIGGKIVSDKLSVNNIEVKIGEIGETPQITYTNIQGNYIESVGTVPVEIIPVSDFLTFSPQRITANSEGDYYNFEITDAQLHLNGNFTVENSNYDNFTVTLTINGVTKTTTSTPSGNFSLPFSLTEIGAAIQYTINVSNPNYFPKTVQGYILPPFTQNFDLDVDPIVFTNADLTPTLVTVSQTNSNAGYTSLVNAISDVRPNGTVIISGTYTISSDEESRISFNKNITIKGIGNNTIIESPEFQVFHLNSPEITEETIISNINFRDCSSSSFNTNYGGAIQISDGAHPIIKNCTFSHCAAQIDYETQFTGGAGGAIYIDNPTTYPIKIQNCKFDSCFVIDLDGGSAIAYRGLGNLIIDNCDFNDNYVDEWTGMGGSNGQMIHTNILYYTEYYTEYVNQYNENVEITNSTFHKSPGSSYDTNSITFYPDNPNCQSGNLIFKNNCFDGQNGFTLYDRYGVINIVIENNIFKNGLCGQSLHYSGGTTTPSNYDYISIRNNNYINMNNGLVLYDAPEYSIKNSIFQDCGTAISWNHGPYGDLTLKNNLFYSNTTNYWMGSNGHSVVTENNLFVDPQLDSNYVPIWTSTTKSPCIDAGYKWGDPDGDNTRRDIGAKYYVHQDGYDSRIFYENDPGVPNSNRGDYINWVCFPVIDKILDNADKATTVLGDPGLLAIPPHQRLDYLEWKECPDEHESGDHQIIYNGTGWHNVNHQFNYTDGYKLKLMNHSGNFLYELSGQLAPEDTEIKLRHGWNWIGYFLKDSHNPFDALAPIWDNISQIKHHDWALNKSENKWIGPSNYTINYGDMIMVYCDVPVTFTYCNNGGNNPNMKGRSTLFDYTEQSDYTPVYVDMNSTSKSEQEIAIFVDGVCYGASKVDADTVQINAYLQNIDPNEDHNVEFVIRGADKSGSKKIADYSVMNNLTGKFHSESLDLSKGSDFYFVSFKSKPDNSGDVSPLKTELKNYPNPFNPETTIDFTIPESGNVRLSIYNVKGQLVKTLVNGKKEAGQHKIIWKGKNTNNETVASGIYFYKLETQSKTIYKKMLLMK